MLSIDISIQCKDNHIVFNSKNSHAKSDSKTTGIGLDNIKKRLELLYQNNYTLDIIESNDLFEVQLQLKLADV